MYNFNKLYKTRADLIELINRNDLKALSGLLLESNEPTNESNYINLNFVDRDGQTPLHRSCQLGHLHITQCLIKHGASQSIKNKDGWYPIHLATFFGHFDIVMYLLDENNFKKESLIAVYDEQSNHQSIKIQTNPITNLNVRSGNLGKNDENEEDWSDYSQSDSESDESESEDQSEEHNLNITNSHENYFDNENQFDLNESQILDLLSDLSLNDLKNILD